MSSFCDSRFSAFSAFSFLLYTRKLQRIVFFLSSSLYRLLVIYICIKMPRKNGKESLQSFSRLFSPQPTHIAHQSRLLGFRFFFYSLPISVCYCMSLSPMRVTASVMIASDGIQPTNESSPSSIH